MKNLKTLTNNTPPLPRYTESGIHAYLISAEVESYKQDRYVFGINGVSPCVVAQRANKIIFDLWFMNEVDDG